MPIGGFVVNLHPDKIPEGLARLEMMEGLEIHGSDEKGNVVVVLESQTSEQMEEMVKDIMAVEQVLSVGLTYFNAEDEVEKIKAGTYVPERSFGRKPLH